MRNLETSAEAPASNGSGRRRVELSNAIVSVWKEYYGRGPTSARTFIEDDFVFIVLRDGLTRNEQTLLDAGHAELVREVRVRFNEVMAETASAMVADIMGRPVIAHHSQVVFDPAMTFEIFALGDGDGEGDGEAGRGDGDGDGDGRVP